jgi:hypothetical protein
MFYYLKVDEWLESRDLKIRILEYVFAGNTPWRVVCQNAESLSYSEEEVHEHKIT